MPTLRDLPQYPPKLLLYGSPGTGKTCFVTSYGEGMQFIDLDGNLQSARTLQDAWTADRQKVDIIPCLESDPEKGEAWGKFKTVIQSITKQCSEKKYPFKALAIDSFTSLADSCLRSIKANSGILNDPTRMTQQLWGLAIDELDRVLVYIKALPIPVVVIFHDRQEEETEGSGKYAVTVTYTRINIFGKQLPSKIIGKFDEVLRQKVRTVEGKMKPYLQTIPDAYTVVRSGSNLKDGFLCEKGLKELLNQLNWKG